MKLINLVRSLGGLGAGLILSPWRPCNLAAFHLGRSGSRLLGDLLKQHPNIVWDGELLSPGRLEGIASRWPLLSGDPLKVLRLRMLLAGKRCFGFETQPTQVEYLDITLPAYVERLESWGVHHFILLERRNHLRRIVSMLVARQTAQWHLKSDEVPELVQIELDVDRLQLFRGRDTQSRSLVEQLAHEERAVDQLLEILSPRRLLRLNYEEDLAKRPETAYERTCEFAKLAPHPVQVRFGRTNPYTLSEVITNYSDVKRVLAGTRYEWMLSD